MKPHARLIRNLIIGIFSVIVFCGFIGFILRIMAKIMEGKGLDYYFSWHGVKMSYIGVLATLIIIPVVMLIAWGIRYWIQREEKEFLNVYGKKRNDDKA